MIRFVFRLAAMFSLAVAIIFAVLDATRSIAASALVATPLGVSWSETSPETLEDLQVWIETRLWPEVWDPGVLFILQLPGFVVFAALAFILYAIGRRPERGSGRFAAEI